MIDFSKVDSEQNNFLPMPVGAYTVKLVSIESKEAKSGGKYLSAKYAVLAPEKYNKRFLFDNINYKNDNKKAQEIGLARLKKMYEVYGLSVEQMNKAKPSDMVGHAFEVFVTHEKSQDKIRERISSISKASDDYNKPQVVAEEDKPSWM